MDINRHYLELDSRYLFSQINERVRAYQQEHTGQKIIRLGIGDVSGPLAPVVVSALIAASAEMGDVKTFRGYGEEQGYDFLRQAIVADYRRKGVELKEDEVFVSDGAKSDLGNILDIFAADSTVAIPDPVYPAYVDTNIMAGHPIHYLDANASNGFLPLPDGAAVDLIYLCSPNNPTGMTYSRDQLQSWVDYALENGAVILYDAAYEAFITDDELPRSIYQIAGAERCAIEFCSLSKTAGFTGLRCGYSAVPHALRSGDTALNSLWLRRQTTKFNGVAYIIQRAAEAVFSPEGYRQTRDQLKVWQANARRITETLATLGIACWGGVHSPYIWLECPDRMNSWAYFDHLLRTAQIVGTPGSGFGRNGEGYFRLTAFNTPANTEEAMERLLRSRS